MAKNVRYSLAAVCLASSVGCLLLYGLRVYTPLHSPNLCRGKSNMRSTLLLMVAVVVGWTSPARSYELQGDAGLLQKAISSLKENWSGVKTWTGTALIEDIKAVKDRPERKWLSEVAFAAKRET